MARAVFWAASELGISNGFTTFYQISHRLPQSHQVSTTCITPPQSSLIYFRRHPCSHMQQIIDLEHASLHMSCPIVPKEAPLPSLRQLQTSAKDPFCSLTQMMHIGLSHFTGRGLPTIWAFISSNQVPTSPRPPPIFTEADGKVIREWARQLDDWLVLWNSLLPFAPSCCRTDA
jgi:hypothetical protein